jgi:hypothetical protein
MLQKLESSWYWIFFPVMFLLLMYFNLAAEGVYDTGDGILHYMISRAATEQPSLLLHNWNKPIYTLLTCLPAQAGYNGIVAFNIICLLASGFFAWKIAAHWKWREAPLAALLAVFAPLAFVVSLSGLTEPLFGLVLIAGLYGVVKRNFKTAAMLLSFLPFVRSEGFFLLPLVGLFFLMRREWFAFIFLGAGTVIYSLIGGIYFHDFLWILSQNPYAAISPYGHGSFGHFFGASEFIFGWSLTGLLVFALLVYVIPALRKKDPQGVQQDELILVLGCFLLFYGAHVVFWWKGLCGSLGLWRVMAAVMPLAALVALRGLRTIRLLLVSRPLIAFALTVTILALHVWMPFKQHKLPFQEDAFFGQALHRTADFLQQEKLDQNRTFVHFPYMRFLLNKSFANKNDGIGLWEIDSTWLFRPNDIIIWDSHFNPSESDCHLETFANKNRFEEIYTDSSQMKNFTPEQQFRVHVYRVRASADDTKRTR